MFNTDLNLVFLQSFENLLVSLDKYTQINHIVQYTFEAHFNNQVNVGMSH